MNRFIAVATAGLFLATVAAADQVCLERTNASTPTSRYVFGDGGATVEDTVTGLTWRRCLLGQTFGDGGTPTVFHDDTCAGGPGSQSSWSAALLATVAFDGGEASAGRAGDWRVPNRKELATLEEERCTYPALNVLVFPGVPTGAHLWSSTPEITAGSPTIWTLNTWSGGLATVVRTRVELYVRLVRGLGRER